jgi:hypothetical protein
MCSDPSIYNIIRALISTKINGQPVDLRLRTPNDCDGLFNPLDQPSVINVSIKEFILEPKQTFTKLVADLGLTLVRETELDATLDCWQKIHRPYFVELYEECQKAHLL